MAGIYIHIPFCKTKCTYCNFFSMPNVANQQKVLDAMIKEIELRRNYIHEPIETIYFGGGTPSVLPTSTISSFLEKIKSEFEVHFDAEITLEANPDDLSQSYLKELKSIGVNRLSMGVQSFDDNQLRTINRRHSAQKAVESVSMAKDAGINNISIDLIYGLPGQSLESWKEQVDKAMKLDVQHISAYALSYEEHTPLWNQMRKGQIIPIGDETIVEMYNYLIDTLDSFGFEHYEISNFAKLGYRSRHNSSYWHQKPYLGIGPSAHSYDVESRQWNFASLSQYCNAISERKTFYEKEVLSLTEKYNDFVMVSLRTKEGINLSHVEQYFGKEYHDYCIDAFKNQRNKRLLQQKDGYLSLTKEGIMISDSIMVDFIKD